MSGPAPTGDQPLDFSSPASSEPTNPQCSSCKAEIGDQYWSAGPAILCAKCRDAVERGQAAPAGVTARTGRFTKALLFGFGGMLAGATVWYLVAKLANIEAGLIAILLGWLVGKGVFAGSGSRGGRRYQVLAVLLTYLGIGVAYVPFAIEEFRKGEEEQSTAGMAPAAHEHEGEAAGNPVTPSDSPALDSTASASIQSEPGSLGLVAAIGIAIGAILTLPVLMTIGGLPGSLLSLLIYSFAILEAWKLTRASRLELAGPFRVGGAPAA